MEQKSIKIRAYCTFIGSYPAKIARRAMQKMENSWIRLYSTWLSLIKRLNSSFRLASQLSKLNWSIFFWDKDVDKSNLLDIWRQTLLTLLFYYSINTIYHFLVLSAFRRHYRNKNDLLKQQSITLNWKLVSNSMTVTDILNFNQRGMNAMLSAITSGD